MNSFQVEQGIILLIAILLIVLGIVFFKQRADILLNLLIRGVVGAIVIYFVNETLLVLGQETVVGINLISLVTSAVLGIPGVILLYGCVMIL